MKKIMIIVGAVLYNKGSEALVKGLMKVLGDSYYITLVTNEKLSDNVKIEFINNYETKFNCNCNKFFLRCINKLYRLFKLYGTKKYKQFLEKYYFSNILQKVEEQDCILLVGADNFDSKFCIHFDQLIFCELLLKHASGKNILYDCSIAKENVTKRFVDIMSGFDYITARDSLSFENLEKSFKKGKVLLIHDPAFKLPLIPFSKTYPFDFAQSIGINVSNIILASNPSTLKYFHDLINFILNELRMKVVLFPHVMNGADLIGLKRLYEPYKNNNNVFLFNDESVSANELKYLISLFDMAIVTRTHASIAAYSMCVPTLVIGYSIKSKGIALDLFESSDDFVIDCNFITKEILLEKFIILKERKDEIRRLLSEKMPAYIENSDELRKII